MTAALAKAGAAVVYAATSEFGLSRPCLRGGDGKIGKPKPHKKTGADCSAPGSLG